MKKVKIGLGIIIAIAITVLTVGIAFALPTLPTRLPHAAKIANPAIDEDTDELKAPPEFVTNLPESKLTKVLLIRYAPGFQKEKPCDNDGICDPDEKGWCADCKGEEPSSTACYTFLTGSKPKWNWVEDYYYSEGGLGASSALATDTWDAVTSATIFGSGLSGTYPWGVYDYFNAISYGDYPETGVIAVTAIWFRAKNIYEYDIMFDTDYFPGSVDLDTVVLHEFGHGAGLGDLYDVVCSENVMYGYYTVIKTTLGSGDIAGIRALYGQ